MRFQFTNKTNYNIMKKFKFSYLLIIPIALTLACQSNPKSDEAKVSEAKEVNGNMTGVDYPINMENSKVSWVGTKPTGRHNGVFALKQGALKVNEGKIVGGSFVFNLNEVTILDLQKNQEMHDKLANHLKSADFFDTENHPEATFELVEITKIADSSVAENELDNVSEDYEKPVDADEVNTFKIENPTHLITGNLTMRGTTLAITFPAEVKMKDGKVHAKSKFNIDRTKWGVSFRDESKVAEKLKDNFIYNTVNVGFDIVAEPSSI